MKLGRLCLAISVLVGCGEPPASTSAVDAARGPGADAGATDGAVAATDRSFYRASADHGELAAFTRDATEVGSDGALVLGAGAHPATDPPSGFHGQSYYNGGDYIYGVALSPVHEVSGGFTSVVPSFEALTPSGTWVTIKVAARLGTRWTKEYVLGVWASDTGTVVRHSVDGQDDADASVATDTLVLAQPADAVRLTAVLGAASANITPALRAVQMTANRDAPAIPDGGAPSVPAALGKTLDLPKRSQMIYANGGEVWCSPTSTSMLLAYWGNTLSRPGLVETVPAAAGATYDWVYGGNGNWPFNTAHASSLADGALHGLVTRLTSFTQIERLIAADIPVAIAISFSSGALDHAPIPSTAGHLITVRGFATNGDVVCNDPAFSTDAGVEVTYDRSQLEAAWSHSGRATYVLWPASMTLPQDPLGQY